MYELLVAKSEQCILIFKTKYIGKACSKINIELKDEIIKKNGTL